MNKQQIQRARKAFQTILLASGPVLGVDAERRAVAEFLAAAEREAEQKPRKAKR